ncbi:MAG: DUF5067 domain-containing protein [Ruminococcaceae bacterium]|nr:DUF5067 domain-containing protein [Oscillospiraceae bacterium]
MNKSKKALLAALFCAAVLSGCTPGETSGSNISTSSDNSTSSSSEQSSSTKSEESSTDSEPAPESSVPVKEANIKVASWKLSTDYSGKDVLVIEYEWTNTKDDTANFMTTFIDKVYQNGVECDSGVIGCDDVDSQKQMNDIKPGVTYNVAVGYLLQDKTNVNVVVNEFLGDELLNETIELGGGEGAAPGGEIAETSIKIANHSISKDFEGADVLVVNYEFYNGEDSAKGFSFMFTDKAFQNGVECDSTVIGCDEVDVQTQLNEIQPGVTYTVSVGYHIEDMSEVEIEVKDLFGTKDYLNEKISLS